MPTGQFAAICAICGALLAVALQGLYVAVRQLIRDRREEQRQAASDAQRKAEQAHARYRAQFEHAMGEITRLQMEDKA